MMTLKDIELSLHSAAGPVNILRGISLTIPDGQTVGLVGPSGSGKSTLLSVLGGLERPSAGSIEIDGQDLGALSEDGLARFRRGRIGIVFQSFHLIPTMTALENVAVPLELMGYRDAFDRAEAELGRVGLHHRLTHYPAQLSGGEQQRVALARAAAAGPAVLLADEPTGNLDARTGGPIIDLMFDLHKDKKSTLVLITHDMSLAEMCERVVQLADGRVIEDSADQRAKQAAQ